MLLRLILFYVVYSATMILLLKTTLAYLAVLPLLLDQIELRLLVGWLLHIIFERLL